MRCFQSLCHRRQGPTVRVQMPHEPLELWGGFECTVVRIGNDYRDQLTETGHRSRVGDLDAVAQLGLRTLRYPVVWETVSPEQPNACDWAWHDVRLSRLRDLGIEPIVGLLHHGSGPRYTNLSDPAFPALLAQHASRVAARYPWLSLFTPVNEPLTTARFSGLYGHWYPHDRSEPAFLRMLVNQCKATLLAMRSIRRTTPRARLVQTEDIGKTFATPKLAYQADYENERRWLSLDLLHGRVDQSHPWYWRFIESGVDPGDLALFRDGEGRPDLIGVNYYLTSERYLDGNLSAYPKALRGGNGRHRYADVEAVRVAHLDALTGPKARLAEVWERYRSPIAVTEVHHGCTRDEQLRWLCEVWNAAKDLHEQGVPIRAVTVWSLLGAVDWNSLLVSKAGFYEPGTFDIRSLTPRLTALGRATQDLAETGSFDHPVLDSRGWWRRSARCYVPGRAPRASAAAAVCRSLLLLASSGSIGAAFAQICADRGLKFVQAVGDGADGASLDVAARCPQAWAVIDATSLNRAAEAKRYPGGSFRVDVRRAQRLAEKCASLGLPLLTFSTDLVFAGSLGRPYGESDTVSPVGMYGRSEVEMERRVLAAHPATLLIRTSALFGLAGGPGLADCLLSDLTGGQPLSLGPAEIVSPTYLPDLLHAALDLLIDGERGIWHLINQGETTWAAFMASLAAEAGLPWTREPTESRTTVRNTALTSERGLVMPRLDDAIARFVRETGLDRAAAQRLAAE
jgi:dTDP-4-dehydrorhamnose reductase